MNSYIYGLKKGVPTWKRLVFSFGITDETFVMASMEEGKLSAGYFMGLISLPFVGWILGTLLGGSISQLLPLALQNAMGIGLYAMFIALIIPASRKKKEVAFTVLFSISFTCLLKYTPGLNQISAGFRIIFATVLAAGTSAFLFPEKEDTANEY